MRIDGNDIYDAKDETLTEWALSGDARIPVYIAEEIIDMYIANLKEKGI